MIVHLVVLFLICLFGTVLFLQKGATNHPFRKKLFIIASECVFFFVIAFRSSAVGLDTARYEMYFYRLNENPLYEAVLGWEPIFLLLNFFAGIFNSFLLLEMICTAIICFGFGYFIYKNSDDNNTAFWFMFFYITLNLYFGSMNLMRQMCAMAITVNIYTVLKRDRSWRGCLKSVGLLLVGTGFHVTAVLAVIYFVPFFLGPINRKTIWWAILLCVGGVALLTVAQNILLSTIGRFSKYLNDERLTTGTAGIYSIVMVLLKILMIALTLYLNPKAEENQEIYRLTFLNVASTALFALQFRTQFALRIGYFFEIFMLLYIPVFCGKIRTKKYRAIAYVLFGLFGLTYFLYMMTLGGVRSNRGTVPYFFFWQN